VSGRQIGKFRLAASSRYLTLGSHEPNLPSTREDCRTKFYDMYRCEAAEYDRAFVKKHDKDLDIMLIFVGFLSSSYVDVLTWHTGWSVLSRDLRIHHPRPTPAPTGPER